MLHQKHITIQEYETSTEKDDYQYLYKKDGELKADNLENEGIIETGDIFYKMYNDSRQNRICRKNIKNS